MKHDEMEWTESERDALERLPREMEPGPDLEERTVAALKGRGLLEDSPHQADGVEGQERRAGSGVPGAEPGARRPPGVSRTGPFHPAWWAAGLAAGLALFFAGLAVGQARAGISVDDLATALRSADAADRPSLVQQTGSLYVESLASLATVRQDPETVGTGVEVGLAALYAATWEMARLYPDDPRLRQVLEALESTPNGDPETDTHWF